MSSKLHLGKLAAKRDRRNLKLASFIRLEGLPAVPPAWDYDLYSGLQLPLPMFANDAWGCCVIAARAHQTLRFEATEQSRVIPITDADVLAEYWREQGGGGEVRPDNGLYLLDALKRWRSEGWQAGGQHYNIFAFAEVDREQLPEIKAAAFLLNGLYCGLLLPDSAEAELQAGYPWMAVQDHPGGWDGHCVYLCGYSSYGPTCITWGKKQLMSWQFFFRYCDEAYAVVDDRDKFMPESALDLGLLADYLRRVAA